MHMSHWMHYTTSRWLRGCVSLVLTIDSSNRDPLSHGMEG